MNTSNPIVRTQTVRGWCARICSTALLAALLAIAPFHAAMAQLAPDLGTAESFAVLGASTVTNTGPTIVTGDLGVSPGTAITGFPPGIVIGGTIHAADAVADEAQTDTTTAYNNLAGQACDFNLTGQDLGGLTLVPGVYCFSSSAQLTGALTLDGEGDPDAVWVFKIGSTLTTASNSSVVLINGAQNCNVFWQVGSSATLGTETTFIGNILALASITLTTDATVSGRALAQNGAVTMDSNEVAIAACAVPPVIPIPPTLGKAFSPATIDAGGTSTLTITLINPDDTNATLTAPLIDTLPTGVVIDSPTNASTTCSGGTVTAVAGGSTVTLSTGSIIPANGSCTVTVNVTAENGGNYINSLAIGALQTSNGSNAAPAVATLTVISASIPPTLGKEFSPAIINAGGTSTLTITLINPEDTVATLTAPLIDTLPPGVVVAATPNASTTCGGTVTADAGSSTVTLSAAGSSIPADSSCTVTVDVTAANGGNYINSLAAGALQTSNGSNAAPAIATLTVIPPTGQTPILSKAFSPAVIDAGGTSTLTITLINPDDTDATLTAPLIDTLPSGVVVAAIPNASTTCSGGTVTAVAGGSTVTLSTGSIIPDNGSCTVTVNVTAANGGNYINSLAAGALQTSNGNNAAPAFATLTVVSENIGPTLSKAFSPATVDAGDTSILTITLINPDDTDATLTAPLIDTLPSGVVVAAIPNASTTCSGGTVTAVAGGSTVTLSTGSIIPDNGSCTVTVNVTAAVAGSYFNSLAAGALQTNNGNNAAPAIATLTVIPIITPALSKAFYPTIIKAGGTSTLTITLSNPTNMVATLTEPLIDTLPSGMEIYGDASTTCIGGTLTAEVGETTVTLSAGATIPANGSCKITIRVTADKPGNYTNLLVVGALQTDQGSNVDEAVATLTVKDCSCNNICKPNICGDGIPDCGIEECDDGDTDNRDYCKNDCTFNRCGDGIIEKGVEECDDGNLNNDDGCNCFCEIEGCPNDCPYSECGNGVKEPGEECDDENHDDEDACDKDCFDNTHNTGNLGGGQNNGSAVAGGCSLVRHNNPAEPLWAILLSLVPVILLARRSFKNQTRN